MPGPGRRTRVRQAVVAVGPPLAAATLGGIGSRDAAAVYSRLDTPRWAPPPTVFGPVWTVLYATIGVTGWRMAQRRTPMHTWTLHGVQLALNAAWPFAFFAGRNKRASLAVIAALDAVVVAETADVARDDPVGAAFLGPYLGWILFATALSASVGDPRRGAQ